jgi:hypothetical protein
MFTGRKPITAALPAVVSECNRLIAVVLSVSKHHRQSTTNDGRRDLSLATPASVTFVW